MQKLLRNKKTYAGALILLCALAIIMCLSFGVKGKTASAVSVDDNYSFEHVSVEIDVRKDKTFAVKETLVTSFSESNVNTGIIRDIQRISRTTRVVDGKKKKGAKYIANLTDVSAFLDGEEARVTYSLYDEAQFHSIKMQTPSGYLSAGRHVFQLWYIYDMSDDKAFGYDDFTFDVLGYAMNRTDMFTCKITFPEDADLSRVTFRTNQKTAWTPDEAAGESAEVSGNTISITAFPKVKGKGYTVQVLLPKGYFHVHKTFYKSYLLVAGISLLAIALCVVIFLFSALNRKPRLEVVEYFPPEGLDIMHASAAWHVGARYKDISALVLKWAGEGLVDIQKDGERDLKIKPASRLGDETERIAELKKMTYAERSYFENLFVGRKKLKNFSTREFKSRSRTFKRYAYDLCEKLVKAGNDPNPVKVKSLFLIYLLGFFALIPSAMVMLYFCLLNDSLFLLVGIPFWIAGVFVGLMFYDTKALILPVIPIVFYLVLYGALLWFGAFPVYDYAGLTYIAPVWTMVCVYVAPHFMRGVRAKSVREEYGKLYGFKKFLLMAELPQIQLLFDEHPDYFSQIMPYCYLMGISKKVQKRFAALNCVLPPYLERGIDVDIIDSSMPQHAAESVIHAANSYSGDGDSSSSDGGGSSGSSGGGGGGGGSRGC